MFDDGYIISAQFENEEIAVCDYANTTYKFITDIMSIYPFFHKVCDESLPILSIDQVYEMIYSDFDNSAAREPNSLVQDIGADLQFNAVDYDPPVFISMRRGSRIKGIGNFVYVKFPENEKGIAKYLDYSAIVKYIYYCVDIWSPPFITVRPSSLGVSLKDRCGINRSAGWLTYISSNILSSRKIDLRSIESEVYKICDLGKDGVLIRLTKDRIASQPEGNYSSKMIKSIANLSRRVFV